MSDNVRPIEDAKKKREKRKPKEPPATSQLWPRDAPWWAQVRMNDHGVPKNSIGNASLFLEHEANYAGLLRWNEMSATVELAGEPMNDPAVTGIRVYLERVYFVSFTETDIMRAAELVSQKASYHPVRQYLQAIVWDGTPRIAWVLEHVLRAEVNPLHESYLRRWLISAVARAMRPGCKVDTMLVLMGAQGAKKSTFLKVLGGAWFTDSHMDLESKDAYLTLANSWIVEWGELDVVSKATQERVKAFLSSSEDVFRQPYGRSMTRLPRSSVVAGTTNREQVLNDDTGSRRFWVLRTGVIDTAALVAIRDQVWAEARVLYEQHEQHWLTDAEEDARKIAAAEFEGEDVWTPSILDWADKQQNEPFTMAQLLERGLDIKGGQQGKREEMRAAAVLTKAGFVRSKRRRIGGKLGYSWSRQAPIAGLFDDLIGG